MIKNKYLANCHMQGFFVFKDYRLGENKMISVIVENDRWNGIYKTKVKFLGILIYSKTEGRVKRDS